MPHALDHSTGAPSNANDLLLKELGLRHDESRAVAQGYMGWYAFFMTTNFLVFTYVLTQTQAATNKLRTLAALFLAGHVLYVVGHVILLRANWVQHARIQTLITNINGGGDALSDDHSTRMASAYPYTLFQSLLSLLLVSVLGTAVLWCLQF
jgi:hypothetical protein